MNGAALSITLLAVLLAASGCVPLSQPLSPRERGAGVGALAGGAGGAVIGSVTGSALAGGLFGLPLGAVTGFYMGDRWASNERTRAVHIQGQEREIGRLRRENRRLRRNEEMSEPEARLSRLQRAEPAPPSLRSGAGPQAAPEERPQNSSTQARGSAQVRQAQKTLNEMGFQAGDVDGVLGPRTEAALKTFQHARGLEVTGRMNQETLAALQITTVSQRPRPVR